MSTERKLYITNKWVVFIFLYYFVLFSLGLYFTVNILINRYLSDEGIFVQALAGSMSMALTASSICYIRKLYKLCFTYSSDENSADQLFLKRLGTMVYFIVRPFFGVAFSLMVVATLKSAFLVSATADTVLEEGFIYICLVTSFYVGFLSGEFINKLEQNGQEKFNSII